LVLEAAVAAADVLAVATAKPTGSHGRSSRHRSDPSATRLQATGVPRPMDGGFAAAVLTTLAADDQQKAPLAVLLVDETSAARPHLQH
jgi:hypothetical protein